MDAAVDFTSISSQFDTVLMGRRTYEHMLAASRGTMPGVTTILASTTLDRKVHAGVTVLSNDLEKTVRDLKTEAGKDYMAVRWWVAGLSFDRSQPGEHRRSHDDANTAWQWHTFVSGLYEKLGPQSSSSCCSTVFHSSHSMPIRLRIIGVSALSAFSSTPAIPALSSAGF